MPPDVSQHSVRELYNMLKHNAIKSEYLVRLALARCDYHDGEIRSFLTLNREEILHQAKASDRRRRRCETRSMLDGIPIAIKDNICTAGTKTTCASQMLKGFISPYNAHVIEKLIFAGAVLFGKTNLDEFAMGSSCEHSSYFPTRNPWNLEYSPGGSSGGSAAAVAAGFTPLALGSDTGGSIRQPAAFCGVVGLKPSYGRVSRYGLVAFASSLDQIGPIGRCVEDCAILLQVIAGHDSRDATSAAIAVGHYHPVSKRGSLGGIRIGVPREYLQDIDSEVEKAIQEAIATCRELGAEIRDVSLPHSEYAIATYYIIATAEASANLARYDGIHYGSSQRNDDLQQLYIDNRSSGFGAEVKRRILLGTYVLSHGYRESYYKKALQVRTLIRNEIDEAFLEVDALLTPTTPTPPFKLQQKIQEPLQMYLNDVFTVAFNLSGHPAISVPCAWSKEKLPIGVQFVGKPFGEEQLLQIAAVYESARGEYFPWNSH